MRLMIFGFGYSACHYAKTLGGKAASIRITARSPEKVARLNSEGWDALRFDGESCDSALASAIRSATHVLVSAPPDARGDPVLTACAAVLADAQALERVVYLSTVGVYGDHGGDWVDENTPLRPMSARSIQRVNAEQAWQNFTSQKNLSSQKNLASEKNLASRKKCELAILRLAGIYGPGRSAIESIRAGTARRIIKPGQVFNRIHVEDIAGAIQAVFAHPHGAGIFNVSDDMPCPPQAVVEHAAMLLKLAPPVEIAFEDAELSAMARSFYGENKRVLNARIKAELGYRFRYPTYREGLEACLQAACRPTSEP